VQATHPLVVTGVASVEVTEVVTKPNFKHALLHYSLEDVEHNVQLFAFP